MSAVIEVREPGEHPRQLDGFIKRDGSRLTGRRLVITFNATGGSIRELDRGIIGLVGHGRIIAHDYDSQDRARSCRPLNLDGVRVEGAAALPYGVHDHRSEQGVHDVAPGARI